MVKDEFVFFEANQDEIVQGHIDEFVIIKDQKVCGYYNSEEDAFNSMIGNELGTFMVKRCQKTGTDVVKYFNNSVMFA